MKSFLGVNTFKALLVFSFSLLEWSSGLAQKDTLSRVYNIEIGSINDSWGGGFTKIYDDKRSYGFKVKFELQNKLAINIYYSGLTNKSLRDPKYSSRMDELLVSSDFLLKKDWLNFLNVYGKLGVFFAGNYGGDDVQKTAHSYFGVRLDTLQYNTVNAISGQLGTKINTHPLIIKAFSSASFSIQPEVDAYLIPDFYAVLKPSVPFKISSPNGQNISLSFGYRFTSSYITDKLINTVLTSETGPVIDYKVRMGFLSIGYTIYTSTNFSVGTYGINLLIHQPAKPFEKADVATEFGFLSQDNGYYTKLLWNKTQLWPDHLMFLIYNQYSTYLRKRLKEYPVSYGNFQHIGVGAEASLFAIKPKFQVNPYLGFNAGIKRDWVYQGTVERKDALLISPQITGEVGVKVQLPKSFVCKNTLWGFTLNYKHTELLTANHITFEKENHLVTTPDYYGFGVFVLMDM